MRARWTEQILDEVFSSLTRNRPDLDPARLARTRSLMRQALRDGLITGYEHLTLSFALPDPDDRHVLAAAIHSGASFVVTKNLRDFPARVLRPLGVAAVDPDAMLVALADGEPQLMVGIVRAVAAAWRRPPGRDVDVLDRLAQEGLQHSADLLRGWCADS